MVDEYIKARSPPASERTLVRNNDTTPSTKNRKQLESDSEKTTSEGRNQFKADSTKDQTQEIKLSLRDLDSSPGNHNMASDSGVDETDSSHSKGETTPDDKSKITSEKTKQTSPYNDTPLLMSKIPVSFFYQLLICYHY